MAAAQDHHPKTEAPQSQGHAQKPAEAWNREQPERHRIVVIGTGFAGIGMAVRLKQAGYRRSRASSDCSACCSGRPPSTASAGGPPGRT